MDRNKVIVAIIIAIAFIAVFATHAATEPFSHEIIHVALLAVAVIGSLYLGTQLRSQSKEGSSSIVDVPTGLSTYNYFIDRLHEERKRADRFGSRMTVVLVSIDNFKTLSDDHGTRLGKELIKNIGETVKVQVRGVDIVSRYSDDQFGVLLPNTGREASLEVAERIRSAIDQSPPIIGKVKATVSVGLAVYPDNSEDDVQLLENANNALNQAKAQGQNQVIVYNVGISEQRAAT